ncbi:MAG TPA: hypothetical protein P5313_01160 [Spirochaetia bacterium]|nr:hypothetical protein [Spirochaetales bacterium]HRY79000.1 hypothetical protein [Spirochaetia bacterium]
MQTIDSAYSLPLAVMLSRYSAPGRVSIPVPSSQVIYAHFEHVSGVAAGEGRASSVDRLKILNTLIDRLSSLKSDPLTARESSGLISSDRVDALLEQYGREAHALAARSGPYAPSLGLPPGSLISLAA